MEEHQKGGGTQNAGLDILESGYKFSDVSSNVSGVLIVCNTSAYTDFPPSTRRLDEVLNYEFDLSKMNPVTDNVVNSKVANTIVLSSTLTNLNTIDPNNIVGTRPSLANATKWGHRGSQSDGQLKINQMPANAKWAECVVTPTVATIQIKDIYSKISELNSNNVIDSYTLCGFYLNNFYTKLTLNSVIGTNKTTTNLQTATNSKGIGPKFHSTEALSNFIGTNDSFAGSVYPANLNGIVYDRMKNMQSINFGEGAYVTAADNLSFSYIIPPDTDKPGIMENNKQGIQILAIVNNVQTTQQGPLVPNTHRFITIRGFKLSGTNTEITNLQPGYVYSIDSKKLVFGLKDLTESGNTEANVSIYAQVSVLGYNVVTVDPVISSGL